MSCLQIFRSGEYHSRKLSKLVEIDHVGEKKMSLEQAIKHGKEKRKPYLIGVLWLVESVVSLIERTDDWMVISIIGSIWVLIGVVSSK